MTHDLELGGSRNLHGAAIVRRNETIFVVLPRELWREIEGGCACAYCSATGRSESPAYWDTLAIAAETPRDHNDFAWTVHWPSLHGAKPKRSYYGPQDKEKP